MKPKTSKKILLDDISFYRGHYRDFYDEVTELLSQKKTCLIVTPNPEILHDAKRNDALKSVLQDAEYAIPDGAGIFVAYQAIDSRISHFLRYLFLPIWCLRAVLHTPTFRDKYGERITGSRLTRDLLKYADRERIPVTIIDCLAEGTSEGDKRKKDFQKNMVKILKEHFPQLDIRIITANTFEEIQKSGSQFPEYSLILATHGGGRQEVLLQKVLKSGIRGVAIGVGGSIDLLIGFRQPVPRFFRRFSGEWLYRLYENPKKHSKRMKKVLHFITDHLHSKSK